MAIQVLFIGGDADRFSALEEYCSKESWALTLSSTEKQNVNLQLKRECWDILIADPMAYPGFSDQLLSEKKKNPTLELILLTSPSRLDTVLDTFFVHAFACHENSVGIRALSLSVNQAAMKIALKNKKDKLSDKLIDTSTGKATLDRLFDAIPCNISVQDKNFQITKTNRRFEKQFGHGIGQYCYQIYKNKTTICDNCPVAQTFLDGKSHSTEEIVTSKNGRQYNVLTRTAPILDENGQVTQVMELSVNITQIRQLNEHLASLGLMLGSMFHGVKGTLTALDGGLYQLETGISQKDYGKITAAYDQITTMVGKIKKMVVEILDYAKSRELNYARVQVSDIVQSITETCRPLADKTGVVLKIDLLKSPESIEVDAGWLEAALVNIIENSVHACVADKKNIRHTVCVAVSQPDPDQVCFTISDNGTGMDSQTKEKLFRLFFTSKGENGTGLGMFIANRVVQYHGGKIEFESTPGKGSMFKIFLPHKKSHSRVKKNMPKTDVYPEILSGDL